MKAIVLAAGYGTRLADAIGDVPKALIEVGGKTILDHLLVNLATCCDESEVVLVTNSRYRGHFERWREARGGRVTILDDGSTDVSNRLGAVGDIEFVIGKVQLADDVLIVAADNIFMFPFDGLLGAFKATDSANVVVGVRYNPDFEDQKGRGVVEMDDTGRLTVFREKPAEPESHWAAAPLYVFPAHLVHTVGEFVSSGGNPDAPGFLMEYLVSRHDVYAWRLPGEILDVGNPRSLALARKAFETA